MSAVASASVVAPSIAAPIAPPPVDNVDASFFELWAEWREAAIDEMRASRATREERAAERKKIEVAELERAVDHACDRRLDLESKIFDLTPSTPNTIAAAILIEMVHACCDEKRLGMSTDGMLILADRVLGILRPQLSGVIAEYVAELLDSPNVEIRQMAFWPSDLVDETDSSGALA